MSRKLCKKMNSPAYDVLKAAWPSYLVPTIDKYLRADIGRRTVSEELPLANAQTVNIDEQVLTYRSTPDGVLVADAEGLVALLVTDDVVGDGLADLELVPLSCSRFLVVGPTCITLFDLLTGVGAYVVRPRERDVKLRACRLSDSTFVVADMDLLIFRGQSVRFAQMASENAPSGGGPLGRFGVWTFFGDPRQRRARVRHLARSWLEVRVFRISSKARSVWFQMALDRGTQAFGRVHHGLDTRPHSPRRCANHVRL